MPRLTVVLAVGVLLVLAGCSTFGGVDGTTRQPFDVDTTTSAETTTTTTTTTSVPAVVDTSPVISFNPVNDTIPSPFDIVNAHETKLSGRPYVVEYDQTQTYANGTTRLREQVRTTYGGNHTHYVQDMRARFGNDSMHRQLYANGTSVWSLTDHDETTNETPELLQRVNGNPVPPSNVLVSRSSETILAGMLKMSVTDVQALAVVPSDVSVPVYRVVMNETQTQNPDDGAEPSNASLTLIVTENGRIVEYDHEYTYVEDGVTVHVKTRVQYLAVDTATVDRPEWVPTNTSNTSNASITSSASSVSIASSRTKATPMSVRTPNPSTQSSLRARPVT